MIAQKPLLLVDIDGVISLFGEPGAGLPEGDFLFVDGMPHVLSRTAGDHLRELRTAFELAWCSGWEEKANEYLPHALGLPGPLPWVDLSRPAAPGTSVAGHWKLDPIDGFCEHTRPLAWIDDALDEACEQWAARRPGPTLLVATRPETGLQAQHVADLLAWSRMVK